MIVADASVVVEFLMGTESGARAEATLDRSAAIHAPALLDAEVAQVLRRLAASGILGPSHGGALIELLQELPVERHRIDPLLPRIWALRGNLTAYDAAYVALAEALECPLATFDERIAGAPGVVTEIVRP